MPRDDPLADRYYLSDVRVVELADEQAEYCGRLLAGLGADVIKVEPPEGSPTRRIGPFYQDRLDPEGSLYFWHYNLGKRSVALDLESPAGREQLLELLASAHVLLESTPAGYLDRLGLEAASLRERFPALVVARVSPFGETGPWKDWKGSDLVHLALGGPMINSGYDPEPDGTYDLPPIAPQMWHAYHIAGELMAIAVLGALFHLRRTGQGQRLVCPVHQAVSCNTEVDVPRWLFLRQPIYRQTCRHAAETLTPPNIGDTKDGRWMMGFRTIGPRDRQGLLDFLERHDAAADLADERDQPPPEPGTRAAQERADHVQDVVLRLFRRFRLDRLPWHDAQEAGLLWAPVRKPHENLADAHWRQRGSFGEVEHPELGRTLTYTARKWISSDAEWKVGPRAPRVGEQTQEVFSDLSRSRLASRDTREPARRSHWGKPFALSGVRVLDFTWWLASGGGPRFLSALGAEDIKVEWTANLDRMRGGGVYPVGGKAARERATAPLAMDTSDPLRGGGAFHDYHAGQRSISLNVRDPRGLAIAKRLIAVSDIVAEGFSPGVLESWGLSYEEMRRIKPDITYVQQSGMGAQGTYGKFRAVGPIAASLAGITDMSGLPEPAPPAGWGYSYLDWFGAYNLATAALAALNYRERTGRGQWIDASQVDAGIFLTGTAVLDWAANGRVWQRYGNRSPYKPAAPHGAYRCAGRDRWIAIACFTEEEWHALCHVAGEPPWAVDPRFATLDQRLAHQDPLDTAVTAWTETQDARALMERLQAAGVPAGLCQTAEDRIDHDPQLAALNWCTDLHATDLGTWPVREVPVHLSETPASMGGPVDRGRPAYGEDNGYVFGDLLGMSAQEIARLSEDGVI